MARYNASWEFHTEDKEVITLLKLIEEPVKEEKKEVKEEVKDIKLLLKVAKLLKELNLD